MTTNNDYAFMEQAIAKVTGMLTTKKDIWSNDSPYFENFEIQQDFGVDPLQFALVMSNLKLNRIKKRFWGNQIRSDTPYGFVFDPDAEDSIVDLVAYGLFALALMYKKRDEVEKFNTSHEDPLGQEEMVKAFIKEQDERDIEYAKTFLDSAEGQAMIQEQYEQWEAAQEAEQGLQAVKRQMELIQSGQLNVPACERPLTLMNGMSYD